MMIFKRNFRLKFRENDFLSARLVYEGPAGNDKPNFAVESTDAKAEKLLKDPKSFDPEKDYQANLTRINDIAKSKNVPKEDPAYKDALAKLEYNKGRYLETQAFAVEKIKAWPLLKEYSVERKSGGVGDFKKGLEADKAYNALIGHWNRMAGDDKDFNVNNKDAIKNNIKYSMSNAIETALTSESVFLDEIEKATKFEGTYITRLNDRLKPLQSVLVLMSENNYSNYAGDVGKARTEGSTLLNRLAAANIKITEMNLKAAQDAVKAAGTDKDKLADAKGWEAGAKINLALEKNKGEAITAKLKAETVIKPEDRAKAEELYAKAEGLAKTDMVAAAKLFLDAKTSFESLVGGDVAKAQADAKKAFDAIPKSLYLSGEPRAMSFLQDNFNLDWKIAEKANTAADKIAAFGKAKESYAQLGNLVKSINLAGAEFKAIVKAQEVYLARAENKGLLPNFGESQKGTFNAAIDLTSRALTDSYDASKAATLMVNAQKILDDKFKGDNDLRPKLTDAEKATLVS